MFGPAVPDDAPDHVREEAEALHEFAMEEMYQSVTPEVTVEHNKFSGFWTVELQMFPYKREND